MKPYTCGKYIRQPSQCLCGNPPFKYKNGWVCKRCDEIESKMYNFGNRRHKNGEVMP